MPRKSYPHKNAAMRYARDVVAGKIEACLYVRQACQRHLNDYARSLKSKSYPYEFSSKKAERICDFSEKMVHIKGKWAGTTIVLEPWQKFLLCVLFGWIKRSNQKRRFREAYWEIPRKNSKSTMGALVGLYLLSADDEPGAEVYSGATTEKQAHEVFRPAWLMAHKLPRFREALGISLSGTHKNPTSIYCMATASRFEPVIGSPGDGSSPHGALVDEYHEHKHATLYDSMKTGMGAREQPILLVITTAGTDTSAPCYDKHNQVVDVLSGEKQNDSLFGIIYTIDDRDDWTDFSNWRKANPNYGISVFEDYLKGQHLDALQSTVKQNINQCKHLNRWCNAGVSLINSVDWERCKAPDLRLEDFYGMDCWIGLDLASKIDIAAKMYLFRKDEDYYLFGKFYLPEKQAEGETKTHYAGWAHSGHIITTPGHRISFSIIEDDILEDAKHFNIVGIYNDPWNAAQLVANLMDKKLTVVEVPQTVAYMSEPTKELEALTRASRSSTPDSGSRLYHDGNPVLKWMMGNAKGKLDKKDNIFPYKEREDNKIDGVTATILALSGAMRDKRKRSKYEDDSSELGVI